MCGGASLTTKQILLLKHKLHQLNHILLQDDLGGIQSDKNSCHNSTTYQLSRRKTLVGEMVHDKSGIHKSELNDHVLIKKAITSHNVDL